jgi:hypothetical protein
MFLFEPRDEGLFVAHENGRGVAHVDTKEVRYSIHVDGDPKKPKLAVEQQIVTPLPREAWRVHFTAHRFTPPELEAFVLELAAQPG